MQRSMLRLLTPFLATICSAIVLDGCKNNANQSALRDAPAEGTSPGDNVATDGSQGEARIGKFKDEGTLSMPESTEATYSIEFDTGAKTGVWNMKVTAGKYAGDDNDLPLVLKETTTPVETTYALVNEKANLGIPINWNVKAKAWEVWSINSPGRIYYDGNKLDLKTSFAKGIPRVGDSAGGTMKPKETKASGGAAGGNVTAGTDAPASGGSTLDPAPNAVKRFLVFGDKETDLSPASSVGTLILPPNGGAPIYNDGINTTLKVSDMNCVTGERKTGPYYAETSDPCKFAVQVSGANAFKSMQRERPATPASPGDDTTPVSEETGDDNPTPE